MKNKFLVITSRRSSRRFIPSIFATALTLVFSVETTNAASLSWDGSDTVTAGAQGGAGNWNVNSTANWWDGTANVVWPALGGTDDDAIFEGTAGTVTLTSAITANDLTFNTTGYILSGAQTLTLNGTTPTITVGTSITATIGNGTATVLAGSAGLTKAGAGTLILSGSLANTFTGITTINGGTLTIAADTALGAAPGAPVANQLTLDGGTLRISAAGQTLNANRGITLGASGATLDTSTITGTGVTTTIGGVLAGTGPLTLKATGNLSSNGGGDGGLGIKLNQATNTFIGDVTITAGLVSYAHNLSFGDAANKIILNGGGLLDNNANINLARDIEVQAGGATFRAYGSVTTATWSGAITGSGGINRTDGGTLTLSGNLSGFSGTYNNQGGNTTLTGTAATIGGNWTASGGTLTVNSTANQTLAGNLTGAGAFAKNSAGILTLSGTNNHTGATTITAGTLRQGVANAVSLGGALTVNGTSVFDLNGFNASVGSLAGVSTGIVSDDAAGSGTTTLSLTAGAGSSAVNIKDGASRTLALRVTNATGAFALTNGANTFSGGIVLANAAGGTRMSPGTITAGAYGTGAITVGESATDLAGIFFATASQTLSNPIISNTNLGTDRVGTYRVDATGIVLSGQLTANLAPMTFSTNATGSISATGKITGSNGLMLLSHTLGGTSLGVTISNTANDYQGDTVINQNPQSGRAYTLSLGASNVIPNGSGKGNVIINTNGTGVGRLNLGGFSDTINGLSGNGTVDGVSGTPTLTIGGNNATATFSGSIVNAAGSLALAKTGTGTQTLSGASTFSGGTTVSNGTLIATGSTSLGTNSGVTVANGATLAYQPTAAGPLSLGTGVLNFASGSRVRAALGGTVGQSAITSSGAAVTVAGPVTLDIFVIPGAAPAAGTHNLITAGSGLNNATYSIGSVYNAANYTLSGLTQSATAVSISTAAATPLTAHYWKGGFSDGDNVWAISNGTSASNWASDAGGTDTSLTPGPTSTVTFSAAGATNQGNMILGANMSIAGMVVNDTNAIVLNTNVNGFALTLGAGGMQINSGAGAVTIAAPVVLGAAQSWINDGGAALTLAGTVANGGFAYTVGGSAPIALSGTVSGTGALTKTGAGELTISSAQTYTGLTSLLGGNTSLTNSNALATTTVEPNGGTLDFGALTAASLGGLQGSQNLDLLNLSSAPITLTVGGNNSTTTYSGILSGSGSSFYKTGSGTMTISGVADNSYTGTTTINNGTLILGKTTGAVAISGPVTMGGLNTNQPNLRMAANNQFAPGVVMTFVNAINNWTRFDLQGTTQTLTGIQCTTGGGIVQNERLGGGGTTGPATLTIDNSADYSFNGYIRDRDNGAGTWLLNVIKTGAGKQTIAGANVSYTGTTTVNAGTLTLSKTTAFNSPIINSATVELFEDTTGGRTGASLSGAGTYNKTGAGEFLLNASQAITATGQFNIQQGTLRNNNNAVNWSGNKADIDVSSGAILDLFADPIFLDVLTGSGIVQSNWGNATGQSGSAAFIEKLVLGTNDGSGTFAGVIRGNVTNAPLAANTGGGGLQLEKVGAGTQGLTGTNLYTGSTTVTGGTLQLDFATGGTSNIIAPASAVVLAGGTLEILGGSGETNSQTFGGISGNGKLLLTQNGATSINVNVGAVNTAGGLINFEGSDATVGALGNLNFLTPTTTVGNDGTSRLGPHLWNGTGWASTSATGGNHVVQWIGTYTDLTTDGNNVTNPTGELRIIDGTAAGTAATYSTNTTAESLLMAAPTYASTVDLGTNTLTLGNGAGAVGSLAAGVGAQALTVGASAGQGFLTAGTSAAASTLAINNQSSSLLTINSVISNNAATGVVSLATSGATTIQGVNTYTGSTSVTSGTLTIGGAGTLGAGTYAGAISNSASLVYGSSASQTLSGVISGNGSLLVNGSGTLILSSATNTYTGPTNITAGTLRLGNAAALNSTSLIAPASGGTLDLAGLTMSRPVVISGTGAGAVGALYNSSTTVGAAVGSLSLTGNASVSSAVPGADTAKLVNTGTLNLNGNTLTISSGAYRAGIRDITSGNIIINSGATFYSDNGGSQVIATGTITLNSGGVMDTRDTDNTAMTTVHTIALNGGSLGRGQITGNNGGGAGAILKNSITVDATNGGTITNSSSGGFTPTYRLAGAISGSGPLTLSGDRGIEFQGDTSGYTGTATATNGTVFFNPGIATQSFGGILAGTRPVVKNGGNVTNLAGNNTYSGTTTVSGGTLILSGTNTASTSAFTVNAATTLKLDYGTNDNRKIGSGVLTLSGGTIELAGVGSTFADSVASTTLTASTSSTITQTSGAATLNLGAINFNTTGRLNLAQSGIARTTNANNALGLLGSWATIGGSIPAMNDGTGLIVAATTADLTRLSSGSKVIADAASSHVRFIEGTGTAGSFTLAAATTNIGTLTQSAEGGASAATVELASQRLVLNTVTAGTGAGSLTIASAANLGFLKAAGTSIEFRDLASVGGITVNAIIEDGTGATTVTKTDPGTLTFAGTNSYSGGTTVNAGTLTASLGTTAGVRFPFGSAAITANSGTTLRMFAGGTTNAMTFGNAFNLNAATLTSEDANQTYLGNIALTGANTVNVTYSDKSATFSGIVSGGGSLTKALPGVLTLSNANSYTGGTTISGGTIRTTNTAALGAAAQALTLSGGTLQVASDAALSSKNVTVSASSTITLDRATTGGGLSTSFGNLTFGSNFTLSVNKGANVASGISTLNFTGFPALGAAGTTTTFSVGQDVEVNLSGNLSGTQAFARVTKTGLGTLILSGNNDWWDPATNTGLVTISGGTVDLRSQNAMGDGTTGLNRIDLSMAAATTLRLATNTALGNHANLTLTGSGATIVSDRNTAGAGITNQFNILSIGAHTLNVTGGSNVTSGTTQVNFNSATLTGNATLNVVNPAAGSTNVLVSGVMSGAFGLTKSGSGTLTLQGANTYSTTTAVSGGTLNLSGAAGAIASSTGITLSTGGILTLANTSTANNGNRIAGTLAMNGGTLNFTNNAGAVNYSETTGNLSIGGGTNTIATGQAATSQTSTLAFGTLSRTAGTVNFTGTGLGVDARNRITFTGGVTSGQAIGTWATFNGTDFAAYDTTNGVVALTAYTDVTRLESGTKAIANTATNNVRIIEGTGVSPASITLAAPTTTINTLNQSTSGGTSAATIDPDPTNNTLAVNSILVSSGAGSLTIGTTAGDGTLKSAGTSLQVIENSPSGSTINSTIANGTAASTFTKSGSGTLTLTGTNTYSGVTTIEGGILAVSVMANGGTNSGIGAAAVAQGNLVLSDGTLRYTGNTASSNRGFTINAGTTGTVDVSTSAQTLTLSGGIAATTGNLVKSGAGILTLSAASAHSGTTAVTGSGKLTVSSTMLNSSAFSAGTGSTLEFGATNVFVGGHGVALADSRVITVDGGTLLFNTATDFRFGNVTLSNGATWTSNRVLTNYDALLANTASGAATVRVTGTGASTMNGSGGIHLQGVQNFDVADTTASTATDLTVSMILAAQGTTGGAAGGINKTGAGTMSLQGANTYTGATNVVAGVLAIGAGGTIQTTSTITVSSGATLRFDRSDVWGNHQATSSSPIVVNQGTLATNGNFNTIISPTLNGGTVTLNGGASASYPALAIKGTLTAGGTAASTINVGTGTNNFINIGPSGTAGTLVVDVADATASTATDLTINSVLQNNWNAAGNVQVASVLQKTGAGTLNLAPAGGANTFTGGLTVSNGLVLLTGTNLGNSVAGAGTLTIDTGATARAMSHNSLGSGTGTLSPLFVNGGTFEGAEYNHINTITMTGGSIVQRSGITVVDGLDMKVYSAVNPSITTNASATQANISLRISNSSAGPLTANVADGAAATDLSISAVIAGSQSVIKAGAGTLNLTGANTYAGGTTVNQGTLTVGTGGTLGATTGALAVGNNNTVAAGTATVLNLATTVDTTVGSLSGSIAIPTPASPANSATINVATGRTLTINQTVAGTFEGVIAGDGGVTLGASSTNTLTLTGNNTYTGATSVAAGTLALVGGSQASPITVSSGASLSFTIGSPTTSTSSFNLTSGTIKISGTPTLPSYTLITTSTGISGTPALDTPIAGYSLVKSGNTLKLETPYGTWLNSTFANALTQTGLEDDPDGDGIKNLLEFAFGTDPTVNSTASVSFSPSVVPGQPILEEDAGVWYAVFARRTDYVAAGLTYTVEFSSALSSWEATATAPTFLATDGTIDVVRVPFLNFVDISGPNGPQKPTFFRVKVSE
jgi:fibronectin-binding autotransporter adhesin